MLTKQDLQQIREVVRDEARVVVRKETRAIVKEETRTVVQEELVPLKKILKLSIEK